MERKKFFLVSADVGYEIVCNIGGILLKPGEKSRLGKIDRIPKGRRLIKIDSCTISLHLGQLDFWAATITLQN